MHVSFYSLKIYQVEVQGKGKLKSLQSLKFMGESEMQVIRRLLGEKNVEKDTYNQVRAHKEVWKFDWPAFAFTANSTSFSLFVGSAQPGIKLTRFNFPGLVLGFGIIPQMINLYSFSCLGVLVLDSIRGEVAVYILAS